MSEFYWPFSGEVGTYILWEGDTPYEWELGGDGMWHSPHGGIVRSTPEMIERGYLGVRREVEKPDSAATAQQALDEWRACKQQPKAADWAYKWAVDLCERLGAR